MCTCMDHLCCVVGIIRHGPPDPQAVDEDDRVSQEDLPAVCGTEWLHYRLY